MATNERTDEVKPPLVSAAEARERMIAGQRGGTLRTDEGARHEPVSANRS